MPRETPQGTVFDERFWSAVHSPVFDAAQALLIAVTGYGQESDRRRTREAGFDHHLVKPLDPAALFALLAQA